MKRLRHIRNQKFWNKHGRNFMGGPKVEQALAKEIRKMPTTGRLEWSETEKRMVLVPK